jgi:hypothetical protein
MANDLDDLDGAEGGTQPAQGRELVIVDLGHSTIMPPSWPEHRAASVAVTGTEPGEPNQLGPRADGPARWLVGAPRGAVGHRPTDAS